MMRLGDIDFLIIGAAKSATTWLQEALTADPRVRMPGPELHYFSRHHARGDDWYLAQFPDIEGALAVGEKSNSYLECPEAAGRIAAALPRVRLVAQLRDPVERAWSDYCMLYRRGEVGPDAALWLDPRTAAEARFIAGGVYDRLLAPFLDIFGPERLCILLYEDTIARPSEAVATARAHLGLNVEAVRQPTTRRVKDRRAPLTPPGLKRALAGLLPMLEPYRDTLLFQGARALVAREVRYPPFPPELRARLIDYYAPANERLAALLKRDLAPWRPEARMLRPARADLGGPVRSGSA